MNVTKEKIVCAVAALLVVASLRTLHWPSVEKIPAVPPEEAPKPPRITVPVPSLRPDKPLEAAARDPFVPTSAWVVAEPAKLAVPPPLLAPRALPGGSPPGVKAKLVVVDKEPVLVEDAPDPNAPPEPPK
jgi:hypothetical protein